MLCYIIVNINERVILCFFVSLVTTLNGLIFARINFRALRVREKVKFSRGQIFAHP